MAGLDLSIPLASYSTIQRSLHTFKQSPRRFMARTKDCIPPVWATITDTRCMDILATVNQGSDLPLGWPKPQS